MDDRAVKQQFANVVAAFSGVPNVTPPSSGGKFGGSSLKVGGSIFAMLNSADDFVVKLPKERVDELVASGKGIRFDPRHSGKLMKEWLVVDRQYIDEWLPLAREALRFVSTP